VVDEAGGGVSVRAFDGDIVNVRPSVLDRDDFILPFFFLELAPL
jgi:hypothetical protein